MLEQEGKKIHLLLNCTRYYVLKNIFKPQQIKFPKNSNYEFCTKLLKLIDNNINMAFLKEKRTYMGESHFALK